MTQSEHWKSGQIIGERCRIDSFLAEGGAGEVYAAHNIWTSRQVAVKRLQPVLMEEPTLVERFLLEGRVGGRIEHPNVVQVLDMGRETSDQSLFIVQELLRGEPLRAIAGDGRRLPVHDTLEIMIPIVGALVAVHQQGVVHRDIKPENIFLADSAFGHRTPKLLDFGIAKVALEDTLTKAGCVMGTLGYMPPEQVAGCSEIDRRADVWSIGVVLYELMAGGHPFEATTFPNMLVKIVQVEAQPLAAVVPSCPNGLSEIVRRCLAKDRQQRPDSMLALLEDLLRWVQAGNDPKLVSLVARHRASYPLVLEDRLMSGDGSLSPSTDRAEFAPAAVRPTQHSPRSCGQAGPASIAVGSRPVDSEAVDVEFDDEDWPGGEPDAEPARAPGIDGPKTTRAPDAMVAWRTTEADALSYGVVGEGAPASEAGEVDIEAYGVLALEAFARSDFRTAKRAARRVAASRRSSAEHRASMHLLQAQIAYWTGETRAHEVGAIDAFNGAPLHSPTRYQALGEVAVASSALGANDRLQQLTEEMVGESTAAHDEPEYLVACCKLGIALKRAGWSEHVERVMGSIQEALVKAAVHRADVQAWTCLMRAELAEHAGDPAYGLALTRDARAAFLLHGDRLRACQCHSAEGEATLMLGGHAEAREVLIATLSEATDLGIKKTDAVRLKLGLVEIRDGHPHAGVEHVRTVLEKVSSPADWRTAAAGMTYLAEGMCAIGDPGEGERAARAAVELAAPAPAMQAQALSLLATIVAARPMEAFGAASQAMGILHALGGVGEDEARVRLAYALALRALGHARQASEAVAAARRRLLERAARISDPVWRRRFLESVPSHATTMALVA